MTPERWQQIAWLFEEVLEREPQQRAAFLDEACAADDGLRREVESMLSLRVRMGDEFLDRDAIEIESRWAVVQTALQSGQRIAQFEVLSPLGAGAMGEVYLARDTRLNRKVALKLLPLRFTRDPSRLRRFEREARTVSSLNHPNIITVYEVGQENTDSVPRHYIAIEYVEGLTLRERLKRPPLPLEDALAIAGQIAAALEAAHGAGIIHRDIKPENLMVRPDGVVKVLDFGIAKLTEKIGEQVTSPDHHGTEPGTVIGTPGYMSPEQARGLELDARTDVFSLGVVLYEMIAGRVPFRGETNAHTIIALLEQEPEPLSRHAPAASSELEKLVGRALAKDCAERYETISHLLLDLKTCQPIGNRPSLVWRKISRRLTGKTFAATKARRGHWPWLAVWLLGAVVLAGLGWALYQNSRQPEVWADRLQLRLSPLISKKISYDGRLSRPSFSPDGKQVAYSLAEEGISHLWIKSIATERETKITEGEWKDSDPIWSPDRQKLAFFSNRDGQRDLWTVELAQSRPAQPSLLKKLDLANPRLISWARDQQGERIYLEAQHNLFVLDPASSQLRQLTAFEKSNQLAEFSLSPQLDRVVYLDKINDEYCLTMTSLPGGEMTVLLKDTFPKRSPVWFPDGRKIAFCSNRKGTDQVYLLWLDDRRLEQVTFSNDNYGSLAPLPDGDAIAVSFTIENADLCAWDFNTMSESGYYSARGLQVLPEISADGNQLIFQSVSTGAQAPEMIRIKPTIPGESAARLTDGFRGRWSPVGDEIAFLRGTANASDLWRINPNRKTEQRLASGIVPASFTRLPYALAYAEYCWSPDGATLAYNSRKSGQSNLWQIAADGTRDVRLTDNSDKQTTLYSPRWSPGGDRLVYLSATKPNAPRQPALQRVHMLEAGRHLVLLEREAALRLLGWSATGQELFVAASPLQGPTLDEEIELLGLNINHRRARGIGKVRDVYSYSLALAADGRKLAMSARRQGRDNIELVTMEKGETRQLTNNLDPALRYSSLKWAAGDRLFYGKQELRQEVLLITKKTSE